MKQSILFPPQSPQNLGPCCAAARGGRSLPPLYIMSRDEKQTTPAAIDATGPAFVNRYRLSGAAPLPANRPRRGFPPARPASRPKATRQITRKAGLSNTRRFAHYGKDVC